MASSSMSSRTNMTNKTWTWNGVRFETHAPTVREEMRMNALARRLQRLTHAVSEEDGYIAARYAEFVGSTTILDATDLPIPSSTDDDETMKATMDTWLDQQGWFNLWYDAWLEVIKAPNDPALQPSAEKNGSAPKTESEGASS